MPRRQFGSSVYLICALTALLTRAVVVSAASPSAVVELFGGERFSGTLEDSTISIQSRFGRIDVPTEMVSTLVCQAPPMVRQALTLQEGDVLVGRVLAKSLHLHSADGGEMELPVGQIGRITMTGLSEQVSPTTGPAAKGRAEGCGGWT